MTRLSMPDPSDQLVPIPDAVRADLAAAAEVADRLAAVGAQIAFDRDPATGRVGAAWCAADGTVTRLALVHVVDPVRTAALVARGAPRPEA